MDNAADIPQKPNIKAIAIINLLSVDLLLLMIKLIIQPKMPPKATISRFNNKGVITLDICIPPPNNIDEEIEIATL